MKGITQTLMIILMTIFSLSFAIEEGIAGKWLMESPYRPMILHLMEDGTYTVDLGNDGELDAFGNYTLADGQITFQDYDGKMACPPDAEGIYSYALSEHDLVLTKVSDDCEGRASDKMEMTKVE